jgi:ribosomal protein L11
MKDVYEIAKVKLTDDHLAHLGEKSMASQITGTALSMKISIVD